MASISQPLTAHGLRSSPWAARMDAAQSLSGLLLGLFMWLHMFFVSSILISPDAMWTVARFFEGYFFFGAPLPWLVSLFVAGVFGLFALHAWLAMRKFPAHWRQHLVYWQHMRGMNHGDTTLWFLQVITGFAMFFLAPVHLYLMLSHPELIGPYESADRVWSGRMWPLYLTLLFLVEVHGGIGLYRLALKWGTWRDPAGVRRRLKGLKWGLTVFFLVLGLATLAAYMRLGMEHEAQAGERYRPVSFSHPIQSEPPFAKGGQGGFRQGKFSDISLSAVAGIPPSPSFSKGGENHPSDQGLEASSAGKSPA